MSIGMLIAGAMVFNFVITSEDIPNAQRKLKAYQLSPIVSCWSSRPAAGPGLLPRRHEDHPVILPVLLPPRVAFHRHGALRRDGRRQHQDRAGPPPYGLLLFMMNKIADVPLSDMVPRLCRSCTSVIARSFLIASCGLVLGCRGARYTVMGRRRRNERELRAWQRRV